MKTKDNSWKISLKRWFTESLPSEKIFSNVDNGVEIPVILRSVRNIRKYSAIVVLPQLAHAEKVMEFFPLWAKFIGEKTEALLLPETVIEKRFIPENESQRAKVLYKIITQESYCCIASAMALLSPVPEPKYIRNNVVKLHTGMRISFPELLSNLVKMDYDDEYEVNVPGEFSRRGGIIDIFSPAHEHPVRIEFWGDRLESMRIFSVGTQRSIKQISGYTVIPRNAMIENSGYFLWDCFAGRKTWIILVWPEQCRVHVERFGDGKALLKWDQIANGTINSKIIRLLDTVETSRIKKRISCGCFPPLNHVHGVVPDEIGSAYSHWIRQLTAHQINQWIDLGYHIILLGNNQASRKHISDWCNENGITTKKIEIDFFPLPSGLVLPEQKLVILTEKELFSTPHQREISYMPKPFSRQGEDNYKFPAFSQQQAGSADMEEGSYVVHSAYGIGIFRGLKELDENGCKQEMFQIEFADNVSVYVPLWQAEMVTRYIGTKKSIPILSRIGGKKWNNIRKETIKAIRGMALEMLQIQALRTQCLGYSFPKDDLQQHIFDKSFPFPDTADQIKSTVEIKKDMCSPYPMDRLLCGDVGYGKTEVAIRASFKAVMSGKQVAVLVPTTILAQQHFYTFRERFAEYPVNIEMLSRFRTRKEQSVILKKLTERKIDIIIGTHRLIQQDVNFSNLGLVIIDEEQRFGVEHKERFKLLRTTVDVLTMTATPIPRTLYMAMTGMRDLSTIMTSPGMRLPVQTIVCQYDEKIIIPAINREIQRGGQVFYLHNRIKTIDAVCKKLKGIIPGVNFAVAHGRMAEEELEKVMADFLDGEIDVLVCTTIIESGLDIPKANTIIIDRADRFGLAELYQLRGRVGRWTRQAYAYLLLPKHAILTNDVRRRIAAIRQYTQLGAGFRLALRDLEIRGMGNLLGREQSGHINAVGFELYCQFLRSAVSELKGKPEQYLPQVELSLDFVDFAYEPGKGKIAAALPPDYIPSERLRIDAYRRLSKALSESEIDDIAGELRDRYGKLPIPVENMLKVHKIRLDAAKSGYHSLTVTEESVKLSSGTKYYLIDGKLPQLKASAPNKKLEEILGILGSGKAVSTKLTVK